MPKSSETAKRKLDIAFIVPFLYRYQRGIERSCVHLANELVRMDHDVTLFAWDRPRIETNFQFEPGLRIFRVPYVRYFQSRWAVPFYVYELLTHPFDVVNIYFAGYGEAQALRLARAWRAFQINFIVGYPIEQVPHRFDEFKQYKLSPLLDHVIVKSPAMVSGIAKFFERDDVEVIPNGINVDLFDPEKVDAESLRKELSIEKSSRVVLTVAALEERKGVQHVIRVLPDLLQCFPDLHYIVVGDGPHRSSLEELASGLGVNAHIHFAGSVTDVLPYYEMADLFVLLSHGEGFPNVLLEAWAMELPVLVSLHPPYPDVVDRNVGALVNERRHGDLCTKLGKLLADPVGRDRLASLARKHVREVYSMATIGDKYSRLFHSSRIVS